MKEMKLKTVRSAPRLAAEVFPGDQITFSITLTRSVVEPTTRQVLYHLENSGDFEVQLTYIAEEYFNIDNGGNFDAAAGVYVDPPGQFYLYSTKHNHTGPGETIEFREFGP